MATVYEIKKLAKKVYSAREDVKSLKRGMKNKVNAVPSWWKGNAANTFVDRYNITDSDINRISKSLQELQYRLNLLADALEEAEEARKAEAENARK